ncbi:MAG: fluoride efflux transporter FluC [Marmoricola sp.]
MSTLGWVAIGAAVGAPTRYVVAHYLDRGWHYGTLVINVVGSFILGVLAAHTRDGTTLALWGTGFCGGMTTYSSFAVQSVNAGRARGTVYVIATIVWCLVAAWLGSVT